MARPKVIVFTTSYHPFVGGAEVAIREITKRLKDRFDFYIVTARFRRDLPAKEIRPEGTIIRLGFGTRFDKWLLPLSTTRLSLVDTRFNLVWGVDIGQGSLAAAIYKLFHPRTPFILNLQYGEGESKVASGRFGVINLAFSFMLRRADYVTAISFYLLELAKKYGYKGPGEVIHNGVDLDKFKNQKSKIKITNQNTKIIITTSRLVPKNGTDILIRAVAEVKKEIPDIQGWIIGGGPERRKLELLTTNYSLQTNIKFLGEIPHEEIPKYLHQADVFVRPSRSEGMGNSFAEALAAGLPIIGTPVGGITDIIKDGKTGLFAQPEDPQDLAEKIIKLLKDQTLAVYIVREGQKMVEERFLWDGIAKCYDNLLSRFNLDNRFESLRILIATPLFPPEIGGPATYSKILAEELPHRGMGADAVPFRSVRHLPYAIRHMAYFLLLLKRSWSAYVIYAQDPVSVGFPSAMVAFLLRKKFLLKVVGDRAWEKSVEKFGNKELLDEFSARNHGISIRWVHFLQVFVTGRASKIVVPSPYLKRIVARWGIPEEKIVVIPNALETSDIHLSREEARSKLGLSGTVLVSAGRLVPWKGFEALIEIFPELKDKFHDLTLVIIGSGPEEKKLKEKAAAFDLREIRFAGNVGHEDVLAYLRAGDAFILNTGYEGMPHIVLEAMVMEIPVLTTRIGGNEGLVEDGVNGLLVGYNNGQELAAAIEGVLTNESLRAKLIRNAKDKTGEFTKEKMVTRIVEVLKTL